MTAENVEIVHFHNIVFVILVVVVQVLQNSKLDACLVLKAFLVSYNFYRHHLLGLVVEAFQRLPETTAAQLIYHFKSICNMILHHYLVIAALIIVAVVVLQ